MKKEMKKEMKKTLPKNGLKGTVGDVMVYLKLKRKDCRIFSEERANELLRIEKERDSLRSWIKNAGEYNNTCTYGILKEICEGCKCGRERGLKKMKHLRFDLYGYEGSHPQKKDDEIRYYIRPCDASIYGRSVVVLEL